MGEEEGILIFKCPFFLASGFAFAGQWLLGFLSDSSSQSLDSPNGLFYFLSAAPCVLCVYSCMQICLCL